MDVIPDTLAVVSLNTIYFYDSNKGKRGCSSSRRSERSCALSYLGTDEMTPFLDASHLLAVGGCEYTQPNDPGNLQLDWLDVQLGIFRDRGVSVSGVYMASKSRPPVPDSDRTGGHCNCDRVLTGVRFSLGMVNGACSSDPGPLLP